MTKPALTSDLMVHMLLQQMNSHQQLMQMILSSQEKQYTDPHTEIPCAKLYFPKWKSKVAFEYYRYYMDVLITNTLPLLSVNITTDPGCAHPDISSNP